MFPPVVAAYKGLYCAMEMDGQELSTTMPFIVVYTASLGYAPRLMSALGLNAR